MATNQAESNVKNNVDRAAAQSQDFVRTTQESAQAVSRQVFEATERLARGFNMSKEDADRLVNQSRQNLDAVTRCGTVLTQGLQEASRTWLELGQKQWQRNVAGFNKLAQARSVQEFTAIQIELVREGLEHAIQDGKGIAETSLRSADEASKIFAGAAKQTAQTAQRAAN